MTQWNKLDPRDLSENPFRLIGEDWMLVTAGTPEHCNTMTASWGGLGILWNKPVATVYIRPQRYTYEFVEKNEHFTFSFFTGEWRKALQLCGTKSGRDCDKIREAGLTPVSLEDSTAFAQARLVLCCKKLYYSDIDPAHFLDASLDAANYPGKDYHRMYICEITGVYQSK